ncbi:MAG: 3-isopropylmalate dehydratase large subunit [Bacteroidetes bacterium 4572_117]|nr:MAG: 3-isopropylmalate dehydratase large subunit [Bacteroidetes bacterium 4572_117]
MKTLFDKIWDAHIVKNIPNGPDVLYIDKQFIHEVTSPQAFDGLRKRKIPIFRPEQTIATADHNTPTIDQHLPVKDELSRKQLDKLTENCEEFGVELYGLGHPQNGVVHIIGPELGITLPGNTYVCGDSHTATHGAFGSIAFGIGTSQVEMVMATQCLLQNKPKKMRININGKLKAGVSAKDVILYIISKLTTGGGTGYFIEYAGDTIRSLSMEERMTICNMSIEMGARGGLIAPDETTFKYVKDRKFAPKDKNYDKSLKYWKTLYTDDNAVFDKEYSFDAVDIDVMITYGTNPGMGIKVTELIPSTDDFDTESEKNGLKKSLNYMDLQQNEPIMNKVVNYVFIGSCTNGRIEDLRTAASIIKGRKKADNITAWIVPGSKLVEEQANKEGLTKIFADAGIKMRQPGCSACLAMNDDKVPSGEYCVSTSNRNFEGRQGPGARTLLASPALAAAVAVTGKITNPVDLLSDN